MISPKGRCACKFTVRALGPPPSSPFFPLFRETSSENPPLPPFPLPSSGCDHVDRITPDAPPSLSFFSFLFPITQSRCILMIFFRLQMTPTLYFPPFPAVAFGVRPLFPFFSLTEVFLSPFSSSFGNGKALPLSKTQVESLRFRSGDSLFSAIWKLPFSYYSMRRKPVLFFPTVHR